MSTSFLSIDELRLDEEWIRQPGLYFKYANRLADARTEMDNAKTRLDVVAAEVETKVRRKPVKYGIEAERVTEAMINSAVIRDPLYQDHSGKLIDAQHKVRVLEASVTAIEHRRSALTRLVELKQMDYFSEGSNRQDQKDRIRQEAVRRTKQKER